MEYNTSKIALILKINNTGRFLAFYITYLNLKLDLEEEAFEEDLFLHRFLISLAHSLNKMNLFNSI